MTNSVIFTIKEVRDLITAVGDCEKYVGKLEKDLKILNDTDEDEAHRSCVELVNHLSLTLSAIDRKLRSRNP